MIIQEASLNAVYFFRQQNFDTRDDFSTFHLSDWMKLPMKLLGCILQGVFFEKRTINYFLGRYS